MSFRAIASTVATAALLVVSAFAAGHIDGKWVGKSGGQDVTLEFKADGQTLTGAMNGAAIENGKIEGESFSFTSGNAKFEGRVQGDQVHITKTVEGQPPAQIMAKREKSTT